MEKYYHITSYDNLESISKIGLVPKRGGRTRSIGDNRNAIFLSLGIKNAILMYASLLYHYNCYAGKRGLKAIEFYEKKIKMHNERAKRIPLDEEDIAELEALPGVIERIHQIMEYNDFSEYIGDGVCLTISDIADIIMTDPKDCYTEQTISPEKIKVVLLKNKKTGEVIDHREHILAYFMSVTPTESILDGIYNVVTIKIIKDLYDDKINDIRYFNRNNFEIEEVSLDFYVAQKKSEETKKKI